MPDDAVPSDKSLNVIRRYAADTGTQLLDLFPVFRAYDGGKALYFRYDIHWTPAGHQVVAGALEQYLVDGSMERWCR